MNSATSSALDGDRRTEIPGFREPVRSTPRRVAAWAARIRTRADILPCRVIDISDGGAGLNVYDSPEALAIGEPVELEMLGDGLEWQKRNAFVRHITDIPHGVRVGVEFAARS